MNLQPLKKAVIPNILEGTAMSSFLFPWDANFRKQCLFQKHKELATSY